MRALLSVSDKQGLVPFARGLSELGWTLYSTGGTFTELERGKIRVQPVSNLTGFPEMLDGRVKTLHPAIHAGLLARRDRPQHVAQLKEHEIQPVDLVVVNLYPFLEVATRAGSTFEDAIENIDVGGPALIRSAAKNARWVTVLVDPDDYEPVLQSLRSGELDQAMRRKLAAKAFQHVAVYDTLIAEYLRGTEDAFPDERTIALKKVQDLRYGENPHQSAAFYLEQTTRSAKPTGLAGAYQLHGKELSYNNILDGDAAWRAASSFVHPTVAIIKHMNPCGLATRESLAQAFRNAVAGDPVSAYGGIVAANREIDVPTAEAIAESFYEVVVAPGYQQGALGILQRKKNLRILVITGKTSNRELDIRRASGGLLMQTPDLMPDQPVAMKVVTDRAPTDQERNDLDWAFRAVQHVKSNAIVLARDEMILAIGAGQPNRVTSVRIAVEKAGSKSAGSVLASDAFFPFADGVEAAIAAGVTAIIQPGGSIRDDDVIEAANAAGIAMVFTGERHFRH